MISKKIEYNNSPKRCKHCNSALPYERKGATFCNLSCSASYNNRTRKLEHSRKSKASTISELEYYKSPKKCVHCSKELTFEHRGKTFCNSSCSASYHNKKRGPRSESTKKRIREGLRNHNNSLSQKEKEKYTNVRYQQYCKVSFCKSCGTIIKNAHRITCSKECYKKNHSAMASERLSKAENRKNLGRHRRSYMEQSFETWLNANGSPEFETEKSFKNHDLKKTYFADFYFPSLNLIIELDGTQHRNTMEADSIRDAYIKSHYGITVIRITHQEYQNGSRIDEVKKLLALQ